MHPSDEKADALIAAAVAQFRDVFNRVAFQFSHGLAGHRLFDLRRLGRLAASPCDGPHCVEMRGAKATIDSRWKPVPYSGPAKTATEAIESLGESDAWVLLYGVQGDPEYAELLDRVLQEIERVVGAPILADVTWKDAHIFLASPGALTPYHIDHEVTFLFQIAGERTAYVWDGRDRSVLSEPEIEDYYIGRLGSAIYHKSHQAKARVFSLRGGDGVHHPSLAPHWYRNGEAASVAMAVNFCMRDCDARARVYQVNGLLRRLKMTPTPPGESPWRDRAKQRALGLVDARTPRTKNELIRSGVQRLIAPTRHVRDLIKRKHAGGS